MKNACKRMIAFAMIFVVVFSNTELADSYYVVAEQNNITGTNVPIVTSADMSTDEPVVASEDVSSDEPVVASENASADATEELPVIEISIGNQKIGDYKNIQIKSGEDITIKASCDATWKAVVYVDGSKEAEIDNEELNNGQLYKIEEGINKIEFLKDEEVKKSIEINGFANYEHYVELDSVRYKIAYDDITFEGNKVISVKGFVIDEQNYSTNVTSPDVIIKATDIIRPQVRIDGASSGNAYVGETIKVTASSDASGNLPKYDIWKCYVKFNNEEQVVSDDDSYTVNERGLYEIYFKTVSDSGEGFHQTEHEKLDVYSKVEFANSEDDSIHIFVGEDIYYTSNKTIEVVYDLYYDGYIPNERQEIKIDGKQNDSTFSDLQLVMKVELQDTSVHKEDEDDFIERAATIIEKPFIRDRNSKAQLEYYDTNSIWKQGETLELNIPIKMPNLFIVPREDTLSFSYHSGEVNWIESNYTISQIIDGNSNPITFTEENIINHYKKLLDEEISLKRNDEGKLELNEEKINQTDYCTKEYDNMKILFLKETIDKGIKEGVISPEKIQDENIKESIKMQYTGKEEALELNENHPVSGNQIGAKVVNATIIGDMYLDAYTKIYFQKLNYQATDQGDVIESRDIVEDEFILSDNFVPASRENNVVYYNLIFSDASCNYPTVAAVVRVMKKSLYNGNELSDTIRNEDGREFQVINLFYDDTTVEITFEDAMNAVYEQIIEKATAYKAEAPITFSVNAEQLGEDGVFYTFIDLKNVTDLNVEELKEYAITSGDFKSPMSSTMSGGEIIYTVNAPKLEGNYALCVKAPNLAEDYCYNISNGFVVDVTAPILKSTFTKVNENKIFELSDTLEKKEFLNTDVKAIFEFTDINTIELKEENIIVEVTRQDGRLVDNPKECYSVDIADSEEIMVSGNLLQKRIIEMDFKGDANYKIKIVGKDFAGNETIYGSCYFAIDRTKPKGSLTVEGQVAEIDTKNEKVNVILKDITRTWNTFLNTITYQWFNKETADVTLKGSDEVSTVEEYYYVANNDMSLDKLKKLDADDWKENTGDKITVPANQRTLIYGKVVDKAGNTTYLNTDGLLTDTERPDIIITPKKNANTNGFYNDDIVYEVKVEDFSDSVVKDYSGLKYVKYTVMNDGKVSKSAVEYENPKTTKGSQAENFSVTIDASKNNSNNIVLHVVAVDMAGNKYEKEQKLQIDNVKPEIDVTFDNNDVTNEKYYHANRTATIRIKERNLNTNDVKLDIVSENNSKASVSKWTKIYDKDNPDATVYECKVTFSKDDDYEFNVSCVDKAGNESKGNHSSKFTIDTTTPVIDVSYSGNDTAEYRNHEVIATITITEHNFNKDDVQITPHAEDAANQPSISEFRSEGDRHTATVHFTTDGTYQLSTTYTDLASNVASSYEGEQFVIDLIEPKIEIQGIKDQSAYKDELKPVITFTDKNYDTSLVSLTVTGSNNGSMSLDRLNAVKSVIDNGEQYIIDFPRNSSIDDLYTLTATISDKAGNETQEVVEFSVNRYGSIYTLGDITDTWLDNGVCSYIKEERKVVIVETNVNEIESRSISYSLGGVNGKTVTIPERSECTKEEKNDKLYYEVVKNEQSNGWVQYAYEINAENFVEEGIYNLTIHSKDSIGNETSNISNLHDDSKLTVQFAVDKTTPNVVFTGVVEDELYNETEHTVLIDAQDNIALDQITVYLNGQEYAQYSAKDIESFDNQLVAVTVPQSKTKQSVQVAARDMAGNMIGDVTSSVANSTCEEISFLVTTNKLVQFLHNSWLIILSGVAGVSLVGGIVFAVMRKRRRI